MPGGPALAASAPPFTQDQLRQAISSGQFFGGGLPSAIPPSAGGSPGAAPGGVAGVGSGFGQQIMGPLPPQMAALMQNPDIARFINSMGGGGGGQMPGGQMSGGSAMGRFMNPQMRLFG